MLPSVVGHFLVGKDSLRKKRLRLEKRGRPARMRPSRKGFAEEEAIETQSCEVSFVQLAQGRKGFAEEEAIET